MSTRARELQVPLGCACVVLLSLRDSLLSRIFSRVDCARVGPYLAHGRRTSHSGAGVQTAWESEAFCATRCGCNAIIGEMQLPSSLDRSRLKGPCTSSRGGLGHTPITTLSSKIQIQRKCNTTSMIQASLSSVGFQLACLRGSHCLRFGRASWRENSLCFFQNTEVASGNLCHNPKISLGYPNFGNGKHDLLCRTEPS